MRELKTVIITPNLIDIEGSIFSGQSFRWDYFQNKKHLFCGIIDGDIFILKKDKEEKYTVSTSKYFSHEEEIIDFIRDYFCLDIDANLLFPLGFSERYPELWKLIKPYMGLKILRQNAFEILITFMCAQGLGMKIIRRQISYLAKEYGRQCIVSMEGKPLQYHCFPSPETLAGTNPDSLRLCTNNNCIRAKNIIDAARIVASGGLDLECLKDPEMPLETARKRLCTLSGIGNKIADCILLFGLQRFSAFPIDTHVRQYLASWFSIGDALQSLTQKNYLFLQDQALRILKPEFAGFAGHILFHSWRKEVKHLATY